MVEILRMRDYGIKVGMEQDNWGTIKYLNDVVRIYTPYHGDPREVRGVNAAYDSDLRFAKKVQLENAKSQKEVLSSSKPFAFLESLYEFVYGLGIFFPNDNVLDVDRKNDFRFEVEERFRLYNPCIPLPQREIYNHDKPNLLIPTENE